jgi:hypothetical protein
MKEKTEINQKYVSILTLAQWILDQVPETSLNSTVILVTPNNDWMSKFLSNKPPESTEDENVVT